MGAVAVAVVVMLAVLSVRRLVLLLAAFVPARELPDAAHVPVAVLAAVRNEEERLPILLRALERIGYPAHLLTIVLADDASSDSTWEMLETFGAGKPNVRAIRLIEQTGKAAALNELLKLVADMPLVAVYDAKHAPEPGSLGTLVRAFEDPCVGAASGYLAPANADVNLVSRYCALETWVTQLLHHAGKDRLFRNAPTIGGNCIYLRKALEEVGGFPARVFSEDTEVSLAMLARGWKTQFVEQARASNLLQASFPGWWRQRMRWTAGLQHSSRKAALNPESWVMALGYVDRVALLTAIGFVVTGNLAPGWLLLWLLPLLLTIPAALFKAGHLQSTAAFSISAAMMFPFDVAVTLWSMIRGLSRRGIGWR